MPCYSYAGLRPVIHPEAFVHPMAILIGDAIVGPGCYVGPGASMRGDFGRVELGAGANLQDNCVMHSYPGRIARVAENGHVGHAAVLHGCEVGRGALIGIGAVIMDNVSIGEEALVAAMSFVKEGMQVPPRVLIAGIPARVMRELTAVELQWKARGALQYQELARRSLQELHECEPLRAPEPDRPVRSAGSVPLAELREAERQR
ncbi:MAG TPA: phenylacetic acid degradation protein PaaY [Pseudomonadales bacterium]|nr:phenylacetic acid degradation protein PaaY [Pseudomonadales bacterium]